MIEYITEAHTTHRECCLSAAAEIGHQRRILWEKSFKTFKPFGARHKTRLGFNTHIGQIVCFTLVEGAVHFIRIGRRLGHTQTKRKRNVNLLLFFVCQSGHFVF